MLEEKDEWNLQKVSPWLLGRSAQERNNKATTLLFLLGISLCAGERRFGTLLEELMGQMWIPQEDQRCRKDKGPGEPYNRILGLPGESDQTPESHCFLQPKPGSTSGLLALLFRHLDSTPG